MLVDFVAAFAEVVDEAVIAEAAMQWLCHYGAANFLGVWQNFVLATQRLYHYGVLGRTTHQEEAQVESALYVNIQHMLEHPHKYQHVSQIEYTLAQPREFLEVPAVLLYFVLVEVYYRCVDAQGQLAHLTVYCPFLTEHKRFIEE